MLENLHAEHADRLLPEIPERVAVREAALEGIPLREYDAKNDATIAFKLLAKEVIKRA